MNVTADTGAKLAELAGSALRQTEPWPVVAPRSVDMLSEVVRFARAERLHILTLGTGSSFESTFTLERRDVLAIMMYGFSETEQLSPHEWRVGAGVSADRLIGDGSVSSRRTVGGLLSDPASPASFALRESLAGRLRAIEFLNARGELLMLRGGGFGNGSQPALAPLVQGAGGRLGIIVAARISLASGSASREPEQQRQPRTMSSNRDAAILRTDLVSLFDPDGVFSW